MFMVVTALNLVAARPSMTQTPGDAGKRLVDEGEPMQTLLADFRKPLEKRAAMSEKDGSHRLLAYTDQLLAAFSPDHKAASIQANALPEPLSEREAEILQLISMGLSNKEIADHLVVAVSTVKSPVNSLYGKLGTHRRAQAVVIARELDLLFD